MRRLLFVALLFAAGFGIYRFTGASAPVKRYEDFAEEVLHRRYDAAAAMTDGLTAAELEKAGTQEHIGAGPQMFQTLFPSRYEIESEHTEPDGRVTIEARQTVYFNPVGVESAIRPAMYAKMKQLVTLTKVQGTWRVVSFSNRFEEMDEVRRRS